MSGGGGGGGRWKQILAFGAVGCGVAYALEHFHIEVPGALIIGLLAISGLAMIFGSCEAMIECVEGVGEKLNWNEFVAGTMAGLASNVPEVIMIGFVVKAEPRIAFVVTCLTLHVNAMVFGIYSGLLPTDESGHAKLPDAIVKLGADLLALAAGLFLAIGMLMLTMRVFATGDHKGEGLGALDLWAIGGGMLIVQIVATREMLKRFAAAEEERKSLAPPAPPSKGAKKKKEDEKEDAKEASVGKIVVLGLVGIGGSFIGGHAVGDFADGIVKALAARHYPEMVGAIIVSFFSGVASYAMIASAHVKGKTSLALSNVSGAVTQMPFVVFPCTLIMMAVFAQTGLIATLPNGGVLPIDMETTSVLLMAFPTLLLLWKSITDDGKINKVETTVMCVLFGIIIYFLAKHG
jgi:Ca2+/Na+ antiporter